MVSEKDVDSILDEILESISALLIVNTSLSKVDFKLEIETKRKKVIGQKLEIENELSLLKWLYKYLEGILDKKFVVKSREDN